MSDTHKAFIIAADKVTNGCGSLDHSQALEQKIQQLGVKIETLSIDPLRADWHRPEEVDSFRSGCAPIEALAEALLRIQHGAQAVVIHGQDHIKSDYSRAERQQMMAVYGDDYPLTEAYTELAFEFIQQQGISEETFKIYAAQLFENHIRSYLSNSTGTQEEHSLPGERWYKPVTELFRGVDCANPVVDFCGRLLICNEALLAQLGIDKAEASEVKSVGLGRLAEDGRTQIKTIAAYGHMQSAYEQACRDANIDFSKALHAGDALLDTYTCYPVVPMAFLLRSGLIEQLSELPEFLQRVDITVTGGMNLARGAWNNPALNGLISMHQRLLNSKQTVGLVHGNGGLGYRQGVAILSSASSIAT